MKIEKNMDTTVHTTAGFSNLNKSYIHHIVENNQRTPRTGRGGREEVGSYETLPSGYMPWP